MNKGQALYKRAKTLIPGGTQLLSKRPEMFLPGQWPSYFSKARGAEVWDLDGRRLIDMSNNSVGACPLGYADPDVNAAVREVVDAGTMCTLNPPEEVELAELLVELHPWADMARFARTGGESMALAVRIARASTRRSKVAFCGYHGWSDWYLAVNLCEDDALGEKGLLLPGLDPSGVPAELSGTALAFRHGHLDELHEIAQKHGDRLAAIVAEPQRHRNPPEGFLAGLREIADQTGAVLIFDEISAGFRLNPGGVHLRHGVAPDMAVFSKAMGNGFPIGAVIGRRDVMQSAQDTFMSSTYWTDRIGPTAAVATIRKFREIKAHERMSRAGNRVRGIWEGMAAESGVPVAVDHPDMPPLPHMRFLVEDARAVQTLWCQLMLEQGFLDNGGFYAGCAHTDEVIDEYEKAVRAVFPVLAESIAEGRVRSMLKGPIGHSGFCRLT